MLCAQVMPVLLSVVRTSDDALRLYLLKSLTELVSVLRQHVRKYLGDLMALVHHYWASESRLLPVILTLISEIAGAASAASLRPAWLDAIHSLFV